MNKQSFSVFSMTCLMLLALSGMPIVLATSPYYMRKAEGWHWYERLESTRKKVEPQPESAESPKPKTAMERIKKFRADLDETRAQAILEPTIENVAHYMRAQKITFDKSMVFANTWQKVLLYHPDLDPSNTYPVSNAARKIYLRQEYQEKQQVVRDLAKQYGLFFFFKSTCPYCHSFASQLKDFAKTYGWKVIPISLDGKAIAEYPKPRFDNGIAQKLNIQFVPAVVAVSPEQEKTLPVAFGMVSTEELINRLYLLSGKNKLDERNRIN